MNESAAATVVLLHGFAGLSVLNRPLTRMLRRSGYHTVELGYDSWIRSLPEICDGLQPRIAHANEASSGFLHIVAHSMGGLVARALIHRERPSKLGRVVMLGTPNGGSEIADLLQQRVLLRSILGKAAPALVTRRPATVEALLGKVDYPVGIIAGSRPFLPSAASRILPTPNDGKVSVCSTQLAEAADHIVLPLAHSRLPYHPTAHQQIRQFLEHGHFAHGDEMQFTTDLRS